MKKSICLLLLVLAVLVGCAPIDWDSYSTNSDVTAQEQTQEILLLTSISILDEQDNDAGFIQYEYYDNGLLKRLTVCSSTPSDVSRIPDKIKTKEEQYEYNKDGIIKQMSSWKWSGLDGTDWHKNISYYDSYGNITEFNGGKVGGQYWCTNKYDDFGRLVSVNRRYKYTEWNYSYSYSDDGLLLNETLEKKSGQTSTTDYEYASGVLVKKTEVYVGDSDSSSSRITTVYEYNSDGQIILETDYSENGSPQSEFNYSYEKYTSEDGVIVFKEYTNNSLTNHYEIQYDENRVISVRCLKGECQIQTGKITTGQTAKYGYK